MGLFFFLVKAGGKRKGRGKNQLFGIRDIVYDGSIMCVCETLERKSFSLIMDGFVVCWNPY